MTGDDRRRDHGDGTGGAGHVAPGRTMADRTGGDEVPEVVLDELLAAFQRPERDISDVDFDDPSIDRLLGITPPGSAGPGAADDDPGVDDTGDLIDLTIDVIEVDVVEADIDMDADEVDVAHAPTAADAPVVEVGPGLGAEPAPGEATDDPAVAAPDEVAPADPPAPARTTIVIGGGDDLPDAVYLDEDAELRLRATHVAGADESGERPTIVIADLDDSVSIEPVAPRSSGAMDPRVRARRIAVRRAEGRRRLIWVAVVLVVVIGVVGVVATFASSLFGVEDVRIQGAVYTDAELLAKVRADVDGDPILLVDTRAIERELETSPWVERARVTTDFPHTLSIDIRERVPLATFAGSDGQFRVIDGDGRVLDVLAGRPVDYLLITGANPDTERGQLAGKLYASAAQLAQALPAEIRAVTKSIGVDTATNELSLALTRPTALSTDSGIQVRLGTATGLPDKLARLLQIVRGGLEDTEPIDVSTAEVSVIDG